MNNDGMHTVVLPLQANDRDIQIVSEALGIVGKLRNAALGEMLDRIDLMRDDPRWSAAAKIQTPKDKRAAYQELKKEYGVHSQDMVRICHSHWKDSKWMGDRIGGRIATALAPELWQNLEEYLYSRADRPKYKPSYERNMVWNNDNHSGLLLRDDNVQWSLKTKRKNLCVPVDLKAWSQPRREWFKARLAAGALRRVGIKREAVRGETRLFAIICLQGAPYRSREYLDSIDFSSKDIVGLDLGPTWLALVAEGEAREAPIATLERLAQEKELRRKERRHQRAADRSRAANNKHARHKDGRSVRGVRQPQRSKRGQQKQQWLADDKRRDRINRQKDRSQAVRQVVTSGIHIALEELNYKAWQKSRYGKRMLITSPGDFVSRLQREAELLGGSVHLVDAYQARASQTCLCGKHVGKKPLEERTHNCPYCGLVADRDMVSAALVRELALADEQVWDEGLAEIRLREGVPPEWSRIEKASRTKHAAIENILSSCRTPSFIETTAGKRGVKQSTESSTAKALLCEKPKSDPEAKLSECVSTRRTEPSKVKSQTSLHVPTCKQSPQQLRAAATRKAAVKQTESNPPPMHSG